MSLTEALGNARVRVSSVKKTELLSGLGELIGEDQKKWVRENLQNDLLFLLKLYEYGQGVA